VELSDVSNHREAGEDLPGGPICHVGRYDAHYCDRGLSAGGNKECRTTADTVNGNSIHEVGSLITRRVTLIENHFHMPIEKLRAFASDLKERQRTVKGDRYAKNKRGAMLDEPAQYGDGDKSSAKEDDEGYLPEEKPDYN